MNDDLINKAISINPSIVTPALNPNGTLEQKACQVWVDGKQDRVFVFRESSSAPGQFSKDIYQFSTLDYLRKDERKYSSLPIFPNGAFEHFLVSGIRCSAMVRLDDRFLLDLSTRLNLKYRRKNFWSPARAWRKGGVGGIPPRPSVPLERSGGGQFSSGFVW